MVIYVDIDETVCETPSSRDYSCAVPIMANIEKINNLHLEGNTVVYWTARGTGSGIDWSEVTKKQLDGWGAKYHDIRFNKPEYDLFICDKAINSNIFFSENTNV